jgi:hypothetical protein
MISEIERRFESRQGAGQGRGTTMSRLSCPFVAIAFDMHILTVEHKRPSEAIERPTSAADAS